MKPRTCMQTLKISIKGRQNVLKNTEPLNEVISDDIVKARQETADFQYQTKAIDKKIDVKEVVDNTFIKKR